MKRGQDMSTREDRIEVFEDTIEWIKQDPKLSASIEAAKQNTEVFLEDDYPVFSVDNLKREIITVTRERSFEAAIRLHKENPESKIAVMNFANAFRAGGGVTKGSSAQEESLCRTSTLYPLLYRNYLRNTFYKHHSDLNTPKASDSLVYTEGVVICKTDEDLPKRMPEDDWVSVDVITIAAPDLRDKSNIHAPLVGDGTYMNNAELFGYHVKRAIHMLTVAAHKGADTLVLGAFGCGAFENNPYVVADAYRTALIKFPKVFERVVFAVYCPKWTDENFQVFLNTMDGINSLARIFCEYPRQWGLRGDSFFWNYLRYFAEDLDIITPDELEKWIKEEFKKITGEELTERCQPHVEKFEYGGMSSGMLSGEWWIRTGIPLLKKRL